MHCNFQVQKYSDLEQYKRQCSELFLNKLEFDSNQVHIMKFVEGYPIYKFDFGKFGVYMKNWEIIIFKHSRFG
jgi:hypothetical protein